LNDYVTCVCIMSRWTTAHCFGTCL